ncbi:MAG: zinc-ribbon domain-containing protein [Acetobacteraceae bacterium]|nr:zinc-ribbon domain-containing protein [Pseudomonadota bacterium]
MSTCFNRPSMRLICPSCAAVYEVPPESLRPGRRTRCARCSAMWIPLREDPAVAPPDVAEPGIPAAAATEPDTAPAPLFQPAQAGSAMDRLAAQSPRRSPVALRTAWAASMLLLIGGAAAAYTWRSQVVRVWPPSARLLGAVAPDVHGPPQEAPRSGRAAQAAGH